MSASVELRDNLRQMVAVLQAERQALAEMDLNGIMGCATDKSALCDRMSEANAAALDAECQGLVDAARRLNEVNRQIRNLVAANVSTRLDAITGSPSLYRAGPARAYGGALA